MELYLHSPTYLHGMHRDKFNFTFSHAHTLGIPRELPRCSENVCVFVALDFQEMGLWSGITLVYLVFRYINNLRKERKQVFKILILRKVCLWRLSPRS
jgi:hypothetical protein